MHSEITYTLKAFITLLPTDKGGRKRPVATGYRPALMFITHRSYSCEIELLDKDELKPGDNAMVNIKLLPAKTIPKNIRINDSFTLLEGNKAVGNGIILNEIIKKESVIEDVI